MMGFDKNDKFDGIVKWGLRAVVALMVSKLLWINLVENHLSDYLLAETLLFYPGHYIRRSLLGNIFLPFSVSTDKALIVMLYSLAAALLIWYSLKYCRDKYLLLLYLCIPFGIRIYISENETLYRKELLFFLVIILALQLYSRFRTQWVNLLISILASMLMIMIHESFVFLAMPVMGWIIYKNDGGLLKLIIYFVITMASFLFLSVDPSDQQIATLDQFFANRQIDWSKSRTYLVMPKEKALVSSFIHFREGSIWFFLLFFVPLIAYLFYARTIKKEFGLLLIFQATATLVLCIIAMDYGRWLSFMLLSFFLCLFTYHDKHEFSERIRRSTREKILYVAMIIFVCSIHIPNFVDSHPLKKNIKENLVLKKIYNAVK